MGAYTLRWGHCRILHMGGYVLRGDCATVTIFGDVTGRFRDMRFTECRSSYDLVSDVSSDLIAICCDDYPYQSLLHIGLYRCQAFPFGHVNRNKSLANRYWFSLLCETTTPTSLRQSKIDKNSNSWSSSLFLAHGVNKHVYLRHGKENSPTDKDFCTKINSLFTVILFFARELVWQPYISWSFISNAFYVSGFVLPILPSR